MDQTGLCMLVFVCPSGNGHHNALLGPEPAQSPGAAGPLPSNLQVGSDSRSVSILLVTHPANP